MSIKPGAYGVHSDAPRQKLGGKHLSERPQSRLRSGVDAQVGISRSVGDGGEDDRAAIPDEWGQALRREERALGVDVELSVVRGLGDLRERLALRDAGVDEHEVNLTKLLFDERAQRIDVGQARRVGSYDVRLRPELASRRFEVLLVTTGEQHLGSSREERLDRRQPHAVRPAGDYCFFPCVLVHKTSLDSSSVSRWVLDDLGLGAVP